MTTRKSNAGRKPLLTPEVKEKFFNARALGLSIKRSADLAGISEASATNWLARGHAAMAVPAGKRDEMDMKCLEFLRESDQVDSEWLYRCEVVLNLTMSPGQSRKAWDEATQAERNEAATTARWKLSHQASNEYSTQARTELTGANGGPVQIDRDAMEVLSFLRLAVATDEANGDDAITGTSDFQSMMAVLSAVDVESESDDE